MIFPLPVLSGDHENRTGLNTSSGNLLLSLNHVINMYTGVNSLKYILL